MLVAAFLRTPDLAPIAPEKAFGPPGANISFLGLWFCLLLLIGRSILSSMGTVFLISLDIDFEYYPLVYMVLITCLPLICILLDLPEVASCALLVSVS